MSKKTFLYVFSNGFGTFQYYLDENMNFTLADDETLGLEFGKEVLHKALKLKESE